MSKRKREKFVYDPTEYEKEYKLNYNEPIPKNYSTPVYNEPAFNNVKTIRCDKGHSLNNKNYSSVSKTYFCPSCCKVISTELMVC